jgi:hypothetical protein
MLQDALADLRRFAGGPSPRLFIVGEVSSQLRNALLDEVWSASGRDACRPQATIPFRLPTDSTSRLIIDDVGALSPDDQQALLHWLDRHLDAMVLSFAGTTVFPLVTNGMFLERLFYRLNIVTVTIDGQTV